MAKTPKSATTQIIVLAALMVVGLPFALWEPCKAAENPSPFCPSVEVARNINAAGMWLQLFGLIVVSFEVLRAPLARDQQKDYEHLRTVGSERFKAEILPTENTVERVKKVTSHMEWRAYLDTVYFPVLGFDVTVRRMYLFGLCVAALGYILQLAVV